MRIHKLANLLEQKGHEVELFNAFTSKVKQHDLLHVFNIDTENLGLIKIAKRLGKAVVISSILPLKKKKRTLLYKYLSIFKVKTEYRMRKNSLDLADLILTETPQEQEFLMRYYNIPSQKIKVLPNGAEPLTHHGDEIWDFLPRDTRYVLQVGRFDHNKNQLNTIRALKGKNIHVVFIGGPSATSKPYYYFCQDGAQDDPYFHFLDWQPNKSPLLASALSHAALLLVPSHQETFGLVILEALAAHTPIAVSQTLPILQYSGFEHTPRFNPADPEDMARCVQQCLEKETDDTPYEQLLKQFSWDSIANEHITLYEDLIAKCPKP